MTIDYIDWAIRKFDKLLYITREPMEVFAFKKVHEWILNGGSRQEYFDRALVYMENKYPKQAEENK